MRSGKILGGKMLGGKILAALAAAALVAGCSRHDAEQVVHKDPATVYAAVDSAFSEITDMGNSGLAAENGQETSIERVPNKSLDLKVIIEGKQAIYMHFGFEPQKGGTETRMTGDWDIDQQVLRDAIRKQGGSEAAMPDIPSFALNLAMKKLLGEMARKIEAGLPLNGGSSALELATAPDASQTSDLQRQYEADLQQRQATAPSSSNAPMVDPDAAARENMRAQQEESGSWQ